ncbi:MAG: class I SAM-dependent RNA methyltransferase [Lachnospiraceae bacterium]|jgi:putative N6-adenine-specific DNA methylase
MIRQYDLIAPCHFGMESVLKNEIYDIGYEITEVEDGRVTFAGDAEAIVRANICLRTAERILLKVGSFKATTFDELYEGTKALPWEEYLPRDARFWVTKAASVKSKLFSPSDIQSVMKKAMVDRMHVAYGISNFPETGSSYPIRVFLKKDIVTVGIDTTGESLHKRGYRKASVKAPIAENLAAGLIMLTPWQAGRILVDPFCGSGTFPIEAAMIAANIAPGLKRSFTSMDWTNLIPVRLWNDVREEAQDTIDLSVQTDLQGYDIDPKAISAARENAKAAGVDSLIHFQVRPVSALSHPKKYGFIITNPPYGQRLEDAEHGGELFPTGAHPKAERLSRSAEEEAVSAEELAGIYQELGERFKAMNSWSMYLITAYPEAEKMLGLKAAKNRKIYNGMIKTYFYMFPGPKPPAKRGGQK